MRFPKRHRRILIVQGLGAQRFQIGEVPHRRGLNRLAAAVHAAAGAAHDLDKMPGSGAVLDAGHDIVCAGDTADSRHLDLHARNIVSRFLDAVGTADSMEFHFLVVLPGQHIVGGTQGRFHHAAGRAEDDRRAGILRQRIVEVLVR